MTPKKPSLNPHQITNPPGFSRPWPRLAVVDGMARLELISERPFTDVGFQSKDHAVPLAVTAVVSVKTCGKKIHGRSRLEKDLTEKGPR